MAVKKFKGFKSPTYTQTPNEFYDELMPEIESMAELKILLVAMRHIFGWHKKQDAISWTQFVKESKLSRSAALAGIKACLEHGTLRRVQDGGGRGHTFIYQLTFYEEEDGPDQTEAADQSSQKGLDFGPFPEPKGLDSVPFLTQKGLTFRPTKERELKEIREASDSAESSATASAETLSAEQTFFLKTWERKRFATNAQKEAVQSLVNEVGGEAFCKAVTWAAIRGINNLHAIGTTARKMKSCPGGNDGRRNASQAASKYDALCDE